MMRTGVTISSLGHAAILAWSVLTFVAKPNEAKPITAMPVDIISASDFSQVTAGTRTALNLETPKPFVEKISDPKPTEDPNAKVATRDASHTGVSLGAPSTIGAQLSQSELAAWRARLGQLWNPPAGASNPDELVVLVRIQLGPDGKLTAPPMVLTRGNSALYMAAR